MKIGALSITFAVSRHFPMFPMSFPQWVNEDGKNIQHADISL